MPLTKNRPLGTKSPKDSNHGRGEGVGRGVAERSLVAKWSDTPVGPQGGRTGLTSTSAAVWSMRQLRSMPDGHHPNRFSFHTVEDSVRDYYQLPMGEFRKLGNRSTGVREVHQSAECSLGLLPKTPGRLRIVATNVGEP